MAEWLRRQIANLLLIERAGSSPAVVAKVVFVPDMLSSFFQAICEFSPPGTELPQSHVRM